MSLSYARLLYISKLGTNRMPEPSVLERFCALNQVDVTPQFAHKYYNDVIVYHLVNMVVGLYEQLTELTQHFENHIETGEHDPYRDYDG